MVLWLSKDRDTQQSSVMVYNGSMLQLQSRRVNSRSPDMALHPLELVAITL